jgi:hypothetical protein
MSVGLVATHLASQVSQRFEFEAFTAVMFQVKVFWVMTQCSVVVGYQYFRGPSLTTQKTSA